MWLYNAWQDYFEEGKSERYKDVKRWGKMKNNDVNATIQMVKYGDME